MENIETASDWGPSGTKIIDLDYQKPMTQLQIYGTFKAGTTTWANSPASNFSKIEIVDGGHTIWSGTGMACQGHHMRTTGQNPHGYQHLRNTKSVGVAINLNFGRYVGDQKYAFNPTAFKNPKLLVTWNEAVHNTSCTTNSIGVWANLFAYNAPSPESFLRLYEVEQWTATASGWKTVDLPTNLPVRSLYHNSLLTQQSLTATMSDLVLTEDKGEEIPYDDTSGNIARMANYNSPQFHEDFRIHVATAGDTYYSAIGNIIGGATGAYDWSGDSGVASHMGGSFKMVVETTSQYYTAKINGYDPQGMFMLPLCDLQDDTTWFDAPRLGSWQLKEKGGASVGTTTTLRSYVEQVHPNRPIAG